MVSGAVGLRPTLLAVEKRDALLAVQGWPSLSMAGEPQVLWVSPRSRKTMRDGAAGAPPQRKERL